MQKGFTLIEIVIYLALFAIIIGGGMVGVYQIIQSSDSNSKKMVTEQEINFLIRKINWALSGAQLISVPADDELLITKYNFAQNPLSFDTDGLGNLRLSRGGNPAINLNSQNVKVENLKFTTVSPNGVQAVFSINGQYATTTKYIR